MGRKKTGHTVACATCRTEFYSPASAARRFCSRACMERPKVACRQCGQMFKPDSKAKGLFCSKRCRGATMKTGETKPCAICQKDFYARAGRRRLLCSRACLNVYRARRMTALACVVCHKSFKLGPAALREGRGAHCSMACVNADPATRERQLRMISMQQHLKETRLERAGYAMLDDLGIPYERQHVLFDKFCVDAFVPPAGLIVQFDGDYWHGNPERFPVPDARQRRRMAMDRGQDAYLAKCGLRVLRIWERDMQRRTDEVRARLAAAVAAGLEDHALRASAISSA